MVTTSINGAGTFPEDKFLTVAQAIEGYCRTLWDDKYLEPEQFDGLHSKLVNELKNHDHQAFRQKALTNIGLLNDLSLRDRIRLLFNRDPWLAKLLGTSASDAHTAQQIDDFIRRVAGLRLGALLGAPSTPIANGK